MLFSARAQSRGMPLSAAARADVWACLKDDDGVALTRALVCHGVRCGATVRELRRDLWHEGRGRGVGVFCVAATNVAGVPPDGAVRCLGALLDRYGLEHWSRAEREVACARVRKLGRSRVEALMRERGAWV